MKPNKSARPPSHALSSKKPLPLAPVQKVNDVKKMSYADRHSLNRKSSNAGLNTGAADE